jgi:hypothetical protein
MDVRTLNPVCDRRGCWQHVDCDEVFDGSEVRCGCGALNVVTEWHGGSMALVLAYPQDRSTWRRLTRRKLSATTKRAARIERRAAELAWPCRFSPAECRGWQKHANDWPPRHHETPRGPAELAGWLAREIWSAS